MQDGQRAGNPPLERGFTHLQPHPEVNVIRPASISDSRREPIGAHPRWPGGTSRSRRRAALLAGSGAALAALAVGVYASARSAERAHPPAGRFIDVEGVRLRYLERGGGGPPAVLLHGNGAMVEDFVTSGLLDLSAQHRRVVAIDRPGFGYSERPRLEVRSLSDQARVLREAFARLGLERPVVVGHSLGTLVALTLALEHADAVGGLVLLSGYYFPTPRADVPLFAPPAIPILGDAIRYTVAPVLGHFLVKPIIRRIFEPDPVAAGFADGFPVELTLRPWQIRALAQDTAELIPVAARLQNRYQDLQVPVAIFAGEEDRIVKPEQSVRLQGRIPQSELHLLAGHGHMIHHFAQEEIRAAVDRVAARIERRRSGRDDLRTDSVRSRAADDGAHGLLAREADAR